MWERVRLQGQLIGNAGTAVFHINDAAAGKAVLGKAALHGDIVFVGIDEQVFAPVKSKPEALCRHTLATFAYRDPVDHPIGSIVQPCAFNIAISGIFFDGKVKDSSDISVL